jgi:hypothetical protein
VIDPYLETCVICEHRPCARRSDACDEEDCQDALVANGGDNFGRCYICREGDHEHCIGVPCQCPCPPPDVVKRRQEREAVLAKLSPADRAILGFP